jgi:hypothetical protein
MASLAFAVFVWRELNNGAHGLDSHVYWATAHRSDLYSERPGVLDAYLYSPVFSMLVWPLAKLPWAAFQAVWMAAEAAAFAWLLKPLGLRWGFPAFCFCMLEIAVGNIYAFLAVVAAVGLRYPAAWALPLLTKITPGLGPIWYAARRDWRSLTVSLAVTAILAAVSFVIAPHDWLGWFRFLTNHQGENQLFLPVRAVSAILLTVLAARRNLVWVIAPAMLLANPMVFHSLMALTMLAALPRLLIEPQRTSRGAVT